MEILILALYTIMFFVTWIISTVGLYIYLPRSFKVFGEVERNFFILFMCTLMGSLLGAIWFFTLPGIVIGYITIKITKGITE